MAGGSETEQGRLQQLIARFGEVSRRAADGARTGAVSAWVIGGACWLVVFAGTDLPAAAWVLGALVLAAPGFVLWDLARSLREAAGFSQTASGSLAELAGRGLESVVGVRREAVRPAGLWRRMRETLTAARQAGALAADLQEMTGRAVVAFRAANPVYLAVVATSVVAVFLFGAIAIVAALVRMVL